MISLEEAQKKCPIDECEIKYYNKLSFMDIYMNIDSLEKKKSVKFSDIKEKFYSIGYFKNNQLIKLEQVGDWWTLKVETYLIWESEFLKEAYSYSFEFTLDNVIENGSWHYEYENYRLKKLIWSSGKTPSTTYDYEYDDKGLCFIHATLMDSHWEMPIKSIEYDREKEFFMKNFVITKHPLINVNSKENDGIVNFENPDDFKTKICEHCGKPLTYVLTIDIDRKSFNNKNISSKKIPVLHCFDCMDSQTYTIEQLNMDMLNLEPFVKNASYKFKKTLGDEELENAFLKIGGAINWIQGEEHPVCKKCNKPMVFIMEIQSNEELNNGDCSLMFGDMGKLYVFSCCDTITTLYQCT